MLKDAMSLYAYPSKLEKEGEEDLILHNCN